MKELFLFFYDCSKNKTRWLHVFLALIFIASMCVIFLVLRSIITDNDSIWRKPEVIGPSLGSIFASLLAVFAAFILDYTNNKSTYSKNRRHILGAVIMLIKIQKHIIDKINNSYGADKIENHFKSFMNSSYQQKMEAYIIQLSSYSYFTFDKTIEIICQIEDVIHDLGVMKEKYDIIARNVKVSDIKEHREQLKRMMTLYSKRLTETVKSLERIIGFEVF